MAEFYPPLEDTGQEIANLGQLRVELYDDKNFGLNGKGYLMQRTLKVIGGQNNVLPDFEEIQIHGRKFGDKVNSVKCIIPKGYSLWLYSDKFIKGKSFEIKEIGKYEEIVDLTKGSKVGGKVSSMKIEKN